MGTLGGREGYLALVLGIAAAAFERGAPAANAPVEEGLFEVVKHVLFLAVLAVGTVVLVDSRRIGTRKEATPNRYG